MTFSYAFVCLSMYRYSVVTPLGGGHLHAVNWSAILSRVMSHIMRILDVPLGSPPVVQDFLSSR